jgi:hypothetical protein
MTDANDEHIARELTKAVPLEPGDTVSIKARGTRGESKWVNIPTDRYAAVYLAACTPEASTLRTLYAKLLDMHTDALLLHGGQVSQGVALAIKEVHNLLPKTDRGLAVRPSLEGKRCRHCSDELHSDRLLVTIPELSGFCGANPTDNQHEPEEG